MELNRKCTLSLALPVLDPVSVWIRAGNRTPFWPSAPAGKTAGSHSQSANAHRTQALGADHWITAVKGVLGPRGRSHSLGVQMLVWGLAEQGISTC